MGAVVPCRAVNWTHGRIAVVTALALVLFFAVMFWWAGATSAPCRYQPDPRTGEMVCLGDAPVWDDAGHAPERGGPGF